MLNAAIIGLGWWGKVLVNGARASGAITIVAGSTGRRALAEDFAAEQGFTLHDSYDQVLANPAVQAVILATPHKSHDDQIVAAAQAGKHVFVEKPFALTRAGALRAVAAAAEAGVVLGLGHNRRFHPHMAALRDRISAGELGTILHVEGTMCAPNGLFLKEGSWRLDPEQSPAGGMAGLGIHMVDSIQDLCGPIAEVTAQSLNRAAPSGAEDTTSVLMRLASGATGFVSCMTATAPYYRFCIYGSKALAEIQGRELDRMTVWPVPDAPLGGHATPKQPEHATIAGFDTVAAELSAFAAAVAGRTPFPITTVEMIHSAAVFEAIVRSAVTGTRQEVAQ